jgi:hypothetical protein
VTAWTLCLSFPYILVSEASHVRRRTSSNVLSVVGNAFRFSASAMLLLGVLYPIPVLVAIGNLQPFLVYAAATGLYHSVKALFT